MRAALHFFASGIVLAGLLSHSARGQAVAEPDVDRAGSRAGQTLREETTGEAFGPGERALGDWYGLRPTLVERGVTFEASLITDYSRTLRGGLATNTDAFRHLFEASLTFESKPLFDFDGGKLFLNFQTQNGRDGAAELTGDFQRFSNIDSDGLTALYECWYEQILFDGKLRVKFGKVDAAGEFAFVDNGVEFIHSSPGADPSIIGYPTYPDPATSINVFVYPAKGLYAGVGVYDGATHDGEATGMRGPKTFFGKPSDLFLIAEVGLGWDGKDGRKGRIGVGFAHHTGTFDVLDGSGRTENGATSCFVVVDQTLWRENPTDENNTQGLAGFLQLGFAEEDVAPADRHVGFGATWTGAIPHRDDDVIGIMASYVHFSGVAEGAGTFNEDYELAVELLYKLALTPWLSLKPDLQYIVNPGGNGTPDALVATLRIEMAF